MIKLRIKCKSQKQSQSGSVSQPGRKHIPGMFAFLFCFVFHALFSIVKRKQVKSFFISCHSLHWGRPLRVTRRSELFQSLINPHTYFLPLKFHPSDIWTHSYLVILILNINTIPGCNVSTIKPYHNAQYWSFFLHWIMKLFIDVNHITQSIVHPYISSVWRHKGYWLLF